MVNESIELIERLGNTELYFWITGMKKQCLQPAFNSIFIVSPTRVSAINHLLTDYNRLTIY